MKTKQIISILLTLVVLTVLTSWKLALLFVVGISFHEMCHLWAARAVDLETDGFYLVPFIGGMSHIKDKFKTYRQQIFVMIMGPVGGGLMAATSAVIYYISGNMYFAAAAEWLFIFNIFNLLPLSFLDGGRIVSAIAYSISDSVGVYASIISTILAIAVIGYLNPCLGIFILVFGLPQVWGEVKSLMAVEEGKFWLADKSFLLKPIILSWKEIVSTIVLYLMIIICMSCWCYQLSLIPGVSINYMLNK